MSETYTYFQPEYVSKFKCDGQKCSAKCCRNWAITIDKETYEQYSNIKPESAAEEITRHIAKRDGDNEYVVILDKNSNCPLLTEDNWCSIQKKYGADFLSVTCATYPRKIKKSGNFYECALTLTCPVVAEMVLLADEPLKFEEIETSTPLNSKIGVELAPFAPSTFKFVTDMQMAAITILQERNLTIDQRLMMLGLYLDRLCELTDNRSIKDYELMQLNEFYKNSNFLQEQSAQFSAVLNFDAHEHIKLLLGLLETLYGVGNIVGVKEAEIIRSITATLNLKPDKDNQISVNSIVPTYNALNEDRKNFVQKFSTIFENYLVNEFFFGTYPFKFKVKINLNYGVFVITYKMLELVTFSMANVNSASREDLISQIMWYVTKLDHNQSFFNKIFDYMKDKSDIVEIMQSMLQV